MSDGSLLPCAEGDGGVVRMIRLRLNLGTPPVVPMSTSASNVEVNPVEPYHSDEPEELVILGAMEFEVIPAEWQASQPILSSLIRQAHCSYAGCLIGSKRPVYTCSMH